MQRRPPESSRDRACKSPSPRRAIAFESHHGSPQCPRGTPPVEKTGLAQRPRRLRRGRRGEQYALLASASSAQPPRPPRLALEVPNLTPLRTRRRLVFMVDTEGTGKMQLRPPESSRDRACK